MTYFKNYHNTSIILYLYQCEYYYLIGLKISSKRKYFSCLSFKLFPCAVLLFYIYVIKLL